MHRDNYWGSGSITETEKDEVEQKLQQIEKGNAKPDQGWYHNIIRDLLGIVPVMGYASYDNKFGDNRKCICGHPYYRHFDTYDNMAPIGCKYCECRHYKEP